MEARAEYLGSVERPRLTVVKDGAATYSALPHAVLFDTRLSAGAVRLYAVMQSHWWQGGECWASHATLAQQMGMKERQIRRLTSELVTLGYVSERRRGIGQSKAYSPTEQPVQQVINDRLNGSEMSASAAKRSEMAAQPAISDRLKRSEMSDQVKRIEEDTYGSKNKEIDAANAAPATGEKVKPESRARRLPEDWSLTPAHIAAAEKKGLDAGRAAVEAEKFCDYHRAKGTRMLDWMAAWRTWLGNAVTFDARRQPYRNGAAPAPAGSSALREQTRQHSKWSDPHWDRTMGGAALRGARRDKEQPDGR